ncbi:MAG: protein-L-isoaspartate(D-aspartate) O-methyltransferase [Planctomycetota bacterium]|nr:protein-L-isoaspartate(D-aspartate) O-methyltransferase [Planctomycetota bacterium]
MVEEQLKSRNIKDPRVLDAFIRIPRHTFVPSGDCEKAYGDYPIHIGLDQTISQPYMVALMSQCLALGGWESVLEIGTGSGYQAAILAELVQEVYTIERHEELSLRAQGKLKALGFSNIKFRVGDGTLGWPEEQPFDRIIVTAGAPHVPGALKNQLNDGGLLVVPVGPAEEQSLEIIRRDGAQFEQKTVCACRFVKLIGEEGWAE